MPKRIGYVWEELIDEELCNRAVLKAIARKKKNKFLLYVKANYREYGKRTQQTIINGWVPAEIRYKTINEGTSQKIRHLRIPNFDDHLVHTAITMVFEKHLPKRFYRYACGSLPGKGQTQAVKALERNIKGKKPRYAAVADIHHCYDSITKDDVMYCLRRIFKDEKFLALNEKVLDQMGGSLAIGFAVSHWYAHIVLATIDEKIKHGNKKVFLVRFMDNFVLTGNNKRKLHKIINRLILWLDALALRLKDDWQVFPLKSRMVEFLSYRFGHEKTVLRKGLMYRMSKRFRKASEHIDAHGARTVMTYRGILKHCDSYNFRTRYMYPNVRIDLCRRLISDADKKRLLCRAAG